MYQLQTELIKDALTTRGPLEYSNIILLEDLVHRFLKKISIEDRNACWFWKEIRTDTTFYIRKRERQLLPDLTRSSNIYRVAYALFRKRIPDNMEVLHTCENRLCVNPDHLQLAPRTEHCAKSVQGPDGVIYRSAAEAARTVGLSRARISQLAIQQQKGWRYLP